MDSSSWPNYTEAGGGWQQWDGGGFNGNQRYHDAGTGSPSATWQLPGLAAENYEVAATWVEGSAGASSAIWRIYDGATVMATVLVNNRQAPVGRTINGRPFQTLATVHVASGTLKIVVSEAPTGQIAIDAVHVVSAAGPSPTPTPLPTPSPTPPPLPMTSLQLSSGIYSVNEGGLSGVVTVTRSGDMSGTVTVGYATTDLSAQQRGDYIRASGVLTFNPGETSKSFSVLIVNDLYMEGSEALNLILSSPSAGAQLGSQSTAVLTVVDNDFTNPTTNPLHDSQFFVRQHYLDFLNREADAAGFNFWVDQIASCGGDAQCIELKRINVSAAYFLSIEFQETGFLACLTNKATFGTLPLYEQFERDRQSLQTNFAVGMPGAEAQLEANKRAYFNDFVARSEFITRYGGLNNNQYVQALINNTGVTFTSAEHDALVNGLTSGSETRATVLRKVAEKQTFKQAEFNRVFVLMQYFGYLKRDADQAGFNFWLNKLNSFNGSFVSAEMVKAFLASSEYLERFGPSN
jgi:hypothetical protein